MTIEKSKKAVLPLLALGLMGCGDSTPRHEITPNKAYAVFCYGCHEELRRVTVITNGRFTKNGERPTIENISKLLRPGGKHSIIYTKNQLTDQELEAAASYILYTDQPLRK
jgi:hypothetical protein